ncbi:MAG: hypothetical protein AAGB31_15550, partial [Bdellovibrio sp.]
MNKRNKAFLITGVLALLIGLRLVLTDIALKELNKFLGSFSESYVAHVDNLGLSFLRGAYRFEGASATLRSAKEPFLRVEYIDVSLAWRDLFKGMLRTDIMIHGLRAQVSDNTAKALTTAKGTKKDAEELGQTLFPLQISRVDIQNSALSIHDMEKLPEDLAIRLTQIEGRLSNATPSEGNTVSLAKLKAVLQDKASVYAVGEVDSRRHPVEWHLAVESREL